jgi:hypothetical protein
VAEAERILAKVYAMDAAWRQVPARLVPNGILSVDKATVERLTAAR